MLLVYRIWKETCNAEALSRRLDNWQVRPEKKIAKLYKYLLTAKARGAGGNTLDTRPTNRLALQEEYFALIIIC
jgi:hypothetical protein